MLSTQAQIVRWSFPAFALILGLLWYKRRRVDRADPGGVTVKDIKNNHLESDNDSTSTERSLLNHRDSGINESLISNGDLTSSPKTVSENLDIPSRKTSSSQAFSTDSTTSLDDDQTWVKEIQDIPETSTVQLGSNPPSDCFETMAKNHDLSIMDHCNESEVKETETFKVDAGENEKNQVTEPVTITTKCEESNNARCDYLKNESTPVKKNEKNANSSNATSTQSSERDSANHSPISGVLDGSVTDEARSEGSTDSGKGGSIRGLNGTTVEVVNSMIYEFSIPQEDVGKLIGRHGNVLQSIQSKAGVHIVVKRHPTSREYKLCVIEGPADGINSALEIIRNKFPLKKYPYLTLEQIGCPPVQESPVWTPSTELQLIERINNDIAICSVVRPDRFFVHLHSHPTFPSLQRLSDTMTQLYNSHESPAIPDTVCSGMIFVAKLSDSRWYRVQVVEPDNLYGEQHLVKLVDYGNFYHVSSAQMRQIRSDCIQLPFQAIEVFLAKVQPKEGVWPQEAFDVVNQLIGTVGQAQIEGYIDGYVYVNLYINLPRHGVISIADELVARGYAIPLLFEETHSEVPLIPIT